MPFGDAPRDLVRGAASFARWATSPDAIVGFVLGAAGTAGGRRVAAGGGAGLDAGPIDSMDSVASGGATTRTDPEAKLARKGDGQLTPTGGDLILPWAAPLEPASDAGRV